MPKGKHQSSESKETMTKDVDNTQEKKNVGGTWSDGW